MPMAPWEADDEVVTAPAAAWEAGDAPVAPKRKVGTGEVAKRAGSALANSAIAYTQAPIVGALSLADMVSRLFGGSGDLTTQYGDRFVQPNMTNVQAAALKPGEDAGSIGTPVLAAAPELGKMAGDLAQGGPLGAAARGVVAPVTTAATKALPAVVNALREGMVTGLPAGFRVAAEKQAQLQEAGVDPLLAAPAAATSGMTTVGQFALPASAGSGAATLPARVASRGAQGAAINVPAGVVQRQVENAVLPAGAEALRTDPTDPAAVIGDLIGGMLFGQMGGRPDAVKAPNRAAMGYDQPRIALAPDAPPTPPREPLPLDLSKAIKAVNESLFRAEGGPEAPDLSLVPKKTPTPVSAPDPLKAPIAPDLKLEGDAEPTPPRAATVAETVAQDDLAAATNRRVQAEEAFTLAERRQQQADRDLRQNDRIREDYQGDDAAYKADEQVPRQVTLLDGETPVHVEGMDGGKASILFERSDGGYERITVDAKRLTQHDVPANQRLAQDYQARSSEPGRGVGVDTMTAEKMPRRSTDRIAGDEAGGRAEPYDPTVQEPRAPRGDQTVEPRQQQGGDARGDTFDQPKPHDVPPAPDNRLGDNGKRSLEAPEDRPRLPGPDAPRPGGERFTVDSEGRARADVETHQQRSDRADHTRRAELVRDYSRNELGNTRKDRHGPEPARHSAGDARPGEPAAGGNRGHDGDGNSQRGAPAGDANARQPEARAAEPAGHARSSGVTHAGRAIEDVPVKELRRVLRGRIARAKRDAIEAELQQRSQDHARRRAESERYKNSAEAVQHKARKDLLALIRRAGGLSEREIGDYGIDPSRAKGLRLTGLVRKDGKAVDMIAETMHENGYLTDAEYHDGYDGADRVRELVQQAIDGEFVGTHEQQGEFFNRMRAEAEAEARSGYDDLSRAEKGHSDDAIETANAELRAEGSAAREDMSADDIMREAGFTDEEIAYAHAKTEDAQDPRFAREDEPGGAQGDGRPDAIADEVSRPAQQARADEKRPEPQPGNEPDRGGSGAGDRAGGEPRPADSQAGGNPSGSDNPAYRLNALPLDAAWIGLKGTLKHLFSDDSASAPLRAALGEALGELKGGTNWREKVAKTLGTILWSDASVVKSVAEARQSPTLGKIWRLFSDMGGTEKIHGETFEQEVHARYNRNVNETAELLAGLTPDQVKQTKALLENRQNIRAGAGGAHKAAARLGEILDAERKWLKASGVEMGEVKNYVPRVYLAREIVAKGPEFQAAAEKAYRLMGLDAADAKQGAKDWLTATTLKGDGVPSVPFLDLSSGAPQKNFTKTREIPADVIRKSGLDKFLDPDLFTTLDSYFRRTAKRGAFESRFGGADKAGVGNEKWRQMRKDLEAEGNTDLIGWAENRILSMSGQMKADVSDGVRGAMSLVRAVTVATFLRRAVISSLTEPLQVANRTAAAGSGQAIGNALKMYAHGAQRLGRALTGMGKSASELDRYRVAQTLGTILHQNVDGGVAALRFDGDTLPNEKGTAVSRVADKLGFAAMKASGLHDWTNANMVDSTIIGMDFIRAMGEDAAAGKKLANYELDRLGIPEADHAAFSAYAAKAGDADQLLADMRAGNKQAAQFVGAIDKFSRQVIMKPTAADKPVGAKHPVAQMFYGLQSWMYSYWYNVQRANIHQVKEAVTGKGYTAGERATMAGAPVMYTAAVLAATGALLTAMRDLYAGKDRDKEREEKNKKSAVLGVKVETLRTLSQAQMFGLADPFINAMVSARYNSLPGSKIFGPAWGRGLEAAGAIGGQMSDKNSKTTNTAERRTAQAMYDLVVDPALAVASASLPMPAAAAATFLSQRDELRRGFVDMAGGKKRKE